MTPAPKFVHVVTVPMSFWLLRGHSAIAREAGFDVHAISSPGMLADQYTDEEGVPVHKVPIARRIAPWSDLVSLGRVYRTLRRLKPRAVKSGTPKAGLLGTLAAFLLRIPVRVYNVHGLPMLTAKGVNGIILRLAERVACAAATHVVCVGESMRSELVNAGLCNPDKAIVLGHGSTNGVDTRWFDRARLPESVREQVRARLDIPADALVVGFIGRIGREKGISELNQAWRIVRERCPSAFLVVIGPLETSDLPIGEAMMGLSSDRRVRVTGPDWNTAPLYRAMDLFCLPSHREGLPGVVIEAAAMELPVVAFRVPGLGDAVEDGVTGRLVEPLNVEALADALHAYLSDAQLRAAHGQAGRALALARFQREKVWARLAEFYRSLLDEPITSTCRPQRARSTHECTGTS